jgi:hypothetical protein
MASEWAIDRQEVSAISPADRWFLISSKGASSRDVS